MVVSQVVDFGAEGFCFAFGFLAECSSAGGESDELAELVATLEPLATLLLATQN